MRSRTNENKGPNQAQRIREKLRSWFSLKPADKDKMMRMDAAVMKEMIEILMNHKEKRPYIRTRTVEPGEFGAMNAAAYPVMRRDNPEWSALPRESAAKLWITAAVTLFDFMYRMEEGRTDGTDQ